jgi:hypothetical protein
MSTALLNRKNSESETVNYEHNGQLRSKNELPILFVYDGLAGTG